jgi:ABC-type nitrate/sulfonate/bicarbonate transport system permease component
MKWLAALNAKVATRRAYRWTVALAGSLVVIAIVWLALGSKQSYAAIPLSDMIRAFIKDWTSSDLRVDFVPSITRLAIGYAIAVVGSIIVGFVLASAKPARLMFSPIIAFLRSMPPLAVLPVFLVVFGVGDQMRVMFIVFVCIWPILLNVMDGLSELDAVMLSAARSYRITGTRKLFSILLPAVSPRILTGMRTSLSLAVLALVGSEMMGSANGIGYLLFNAQESFRISDMWAAAIMLGLLGYVLNIGLTAVEAQTLHRHGIARRDYLRRGE